jgi:hypothetical protein
MVSPIRLYRDRSANAVRLTDGDTGEIRVSASERPGHDSGRCSDRDEGIGDTFVRWRSFDRC